jgi:hypothetical protein
LSSVCCVRCLGELPLFASSAGHPLVCPQPLCFVGSALTGVLHMQPKFHRRQPKASLPSRCCSSAPEFPLEVSNPPVPLFPRLLPCPSSDCSPEQVSPVVGPLRRGLRPLVPLCRCHAHDRVRRATPNPLVPFPTSHGPNAPSSLVNLHCGSERRHRWRSWNPDRACRWISGVHPRSGGLGLTRIDLISVVRFGSGCLSARPRSLSAAGPTDQSASRPRPL